jgi:hypothetical protein
MKTTIYLLLTLIAISCTSTKSTLKNVDYKAVKPKIENNKYILTTYANDPKYGYDKDYPINLGFANLKSEDYFVKLFFDGITDEEGKAVSYEKIETCCPFPSKHSTMGVGLLHKYKVTFANGKEKELYINLYEKGEILCPNGFKIAPHNN